MTATRIVLVTKKTSYEELLMEAGTHGAAAFLLQSRGEDIASYLQMHELYHEAVATVVAGFPKDITHTHVERIDLPRFLFRTDDAVVVVGPDGLFANLAKYLTTQDVLAVNPLPQHFDGVIMRFTPEHAAKVLPVFLEGGLSCDEVVLAEAVTDSGERLLAANDFLIGRRDQMSARYRIEHDGYEERQSSSGVLISTGMGSSGWMRSVKHMITSSVDDGDSSLLPYDPEWEESRLLFAVREAFPSQATGTSILYGSITPDNPLTIVSEMPEGGVIFSDGVLEDALMLPAGTKVTISVSQRRVRLAM